MDDVQLAGIPMAFRWLAPPERWHADGATLSLVAGARTDWFVDPSGAREPAVNGAALVGPAGGDYLFRAHVHVGFEATFDAGALMLHAGERTWAKLCFEYSPAREPMVVSVVTRGTSDDANGFVVEGGEVRLRIARMGRAFAFHASTGGGEWKLIRHFTLGEDVEPEIGLEAQSPTGDGCEVRFDEIRFEPRRLLDLRDGS